VKLAATGRGILAFLVYAAVWEGYYIIQTPFPVTPWEIRNHQEIRLMQKGEDGGRHGPRHTKIQTAIRLLESLGSEDGVSVTELSKKLNSPKSSVHEILAALVKERIQRNIPFHSSNFHHKAMESPE